jgi:uncharacterized protein YjbI with pentapeptide repeats
LDSYPFLYLVYIKIKLIKLMSNYPDFSSYGYQIKRQLGQNHQGGRFTYLATNTKTQEPVVIKQFQFAQPGASWGEYTAYESEIKFLQQLNHANIPRYLNSFETPTGFCLVQEYIKASSLAQPRHFTPEEIKQIAIAVLEILVYLQRQRLSVIHRDIKPENILVDRSRQIKVYLVDFGFARMGGGDVGASSVVKGTLGFMPPEQLFNRQLTKSSDLYSLGATLICLLTKTKSTEIGSLIDKDYRINFKPLVPKLSRQFIDWLSKMTAPSLQDRYPNAVAALTALKPIDVVGTNPIQKLLIHLRQLSDSFSDAVLNTGQSSDVAQRGTIPKLLAHLREHSVSLYTAATQTPKARKQTIVIGTTLIVVGVGITSYWQNRHVRQLLNTQKCVACNLQNANLRDAYLENADLSGANLKKANLEGAFLKSAKLNGANLIGAKLNGANLESTRLEWTRLENANLAGTNLEMAAIVHVNLAGADLRGVTLKHAALAHVNLEGANLEGANLEGANLEHMSLQRAFNLRRANLKNANLKGASAYLGRNNLEGDDLSNFDLGEANLERANLADATLPAINLRGANLEGVNLTGANLNSSNLEGANLTGANLKGANLGGANLEGANLEGANLEGANLEGANLKGAIMPNGIRLE